MVALSAFLSILPFSCETVGFVVSMIIDNYGLWCVFAVKIKRNYIKACLVVAFSRGLETDHTRRNNYFKIVVASLLVNENCERSVVVILLGAIVVLIERKYDPCDHDLSHGPYLNSILGCYCCCSHGHDQSRSVSWSIPQASYPLSISQLALDRIDRGYA